MRGIARLHGKPKQQARALRLADVDRLAEMLSQDGSLRAVRNRALILVGFFGAFRRSELVSLTWEYIDFVSDGMIITLARSKTDQTGEGTRCIIPFGNEKRCPVRTLIAWQQASGCYRGKIFRRISTVGTLGDHEI